LYNNENTYNKTLQISKLQDQKPKFVFTHLHIPHYPYFFDHDGKEQPFEHLLEDSQINKNHYVEYLQYGNKKYLELVDEILKNAERPPVIILMGDHGFRHFTEDVNPKYFYQNYASVLLPDKQYAAFTDSLSGVNIFRAFLNTTFRQQLPMLRDSTIFIKE
jgi:phosphoglycerol transferase MdoB-like AlkP superfamily enzyme